MNDILKKAHEINDLIVSYRRYFHSNPEIGMYLPMTSKFVRDNLEKIGCAVNMCGEYGVVTTIGSKGKTILLRADMDALNMKEETDLEFKSKNDYGHCCGHDFHAAMLLGAAKILKENEDMLDGRVKLMFQPGEEVAKGAREMIQDGILENPKVDVALAMHIYNSKDKSGTISYKFDEVFASVDAFKIIIKGKNGHGAHPEMAIDPISIGAHIVLSLQEIISREIPAMEQATLTICKFQGGATSNVIPNEVELEGSIRTYNDELANFIRQRTEEICKLTCQKFRATCEVIYSSNVPVLKNDNEFTKEIVKYAKDIVGENVVSDVKIMGSEDFALIAQKVPSLYLSIVSGCYDDGYIYGGHDSKVVFNENVLPIGTAIYAHVAMQWLKNNK